MQELDVLPQSQVIRLVAQLDEREFTLFLGAGASRSSGVPLASEMIQEWRRMAFDDREPAGEDFESWCKGQPWCDKDGEYSTLFEMLFPNERARQKYVEPKIVSAFPSWCYLYLANIVDAGRFNVIFTTNFDDLINEALTLYLGYNPVVCAADSEVMSISITTNRAKIVKLHGDYLFKSLKNTSDELNQLDPNMEAKVKEFAKQCGMVVIGYAGRDQSVMRVFEELLKDRNSFPNGVYWGLRPGEVAGSRVKQLAISFPKRFHLFQCKDFDSFMSQLHANLKLNLPRTVLQPYEALHDKFERLVGNDTPGQIKDPAIREHIQQLKQQLDRPWAKTTDLISFDLLQAQMALGQRDYKTALTYVSKYCEQRPDDANALTTWGDALAVQAQEETSEASSEQAAAKWTEAIRLNPQALPPRYSLARYYSRTQKSSEAIVALEALLKLVPNDHALRRTLISLYANNSKYAQALSEADWLMVREPNAADLHAMKAAVLLQRGLMVEAVNETKLAVKLDPENAGYHFALANTFAQMGKIDEASAEFNRAIQLDPNTLSYRLQVTNFYSSMQKPELALPHAEAATVIEPDSAEARGWLAQIYLGLGRMAEAQRETEAALKLSPEDVRLLVNAAMLYTHLNRPDVAEGYLRQAAELNPSHPFPYARLCFLYWMDSRNQELAVAFQRLIQIAPPMAQQVQAILQGLEIEFRGDRKAAGQALKNQTLAMVQNQPQAAQAQPWPSAQPARNNQPSMNDMLRSAWEKLAGS
ncbi:MAG: tetratricopeptide repeat protein [Pyrinomonadaceae bacterium]